MWSAAIDHAIELAYDRVAAHVTRAARIESRGDVALAVAVDIVEDILDAYSSRVIGRQYSLCRAAGFRMHNLHATKLGYPVLVILISNVVFVSMLSSFC